MQCRREPALMPSPAENFMTGCSGTRRAMTKIEPGASGPFLPARAGRSRFHIEINRAVIEERKLRCWESHLRSDRRALSHPQDENGSSLPVAFHKSFLIVSAALGHSSPGRSFPASRSGHAPNCRLAAAWTTPSCG